MIKPLNPPLDNEVDDLLKGAIKTKDGDNVVCMHAVEDGERVGLSAGVISSDNTFTIKFFNANDRYTAELLARGILNKALNEINKRALDFNRKSTVASLATDDVFDVFSKIGFTLDYDAHYSAVIERVLCGECGATSAKGCGRSSENSCKSCSGCKC